jgi:hypothetical protein
MWKERLPTTASAIWLAPDPARNDKRQKWLQQQRPQSKATAPSMPREAFVDPQFEKFAYEDSLCP